MHTRKRNTYNVTVNLLKCKTQEKIYASICDLKVLRKRSDIRERRKIYSDAAISRRNEN